MTPEEVLNRYGADFIYDVVGAAFGVCKDVKKDICCPLYVNEISDGSGKLVPCFMVSRHPCSLTCPHRMWLEFGIEEEKD